MNKYSNRSFVRNVTLGALVLIGLAEISYSSQFGTVVSNINAAAHLLEGEPQPQVKREPQSPLPEPKPPTEAASQPKSPSKPKAYVKQVDLKTLKLEELLSFTGMDNYSRIILSCRATHIETPCDSPRSVIRKTYDFLKRVFRPLFSWMKSSPQKLYQACVERSALQQIHTAADSSFFTSDSIELFQLEAYREFLERIRARIHPKTRTPELGNVDIQELIRKFNPYGEHRPVAEVVKNYMRVAIGLETAPDDLKDIRDVSLMNDFYFNPAFAKRINPYCRTNAQGRSEVFTPAMESLQSNEYKAVNPEVFWKVAHGCGYVSRINSHTSKLQQLRDSLILKSNSLNESEKTGKKYSPKFTPEELWVMVRDVRESNQYETGILKAPRFKEVADKINDYIPAITKASEIVKKRANSRMKTGDLVFSNITRGGEISGKKLNRLQKFQRWFSKNYGHVAFLIKPPTVVNNKFSEILHTSYDGVRVDDYSLEDAYSTDVYRINLEKLMSKKLKEKLDQEAKQKGIDSSKHFEEKLAEYGPEYYSEVTNEYKANLPAYRVKTTISDAIQAAIYRTLNMSAPEDKGDIFDRVALSRTHALHPENRKRADSVIQAAEDEIAKIEQEKKDALKAMQTIKKDLDGFLNLRWALNPKKSSQFTGLQKQMDDLKAKLSVLDQRKKSIQSRLDADDGNIDERVKTLGKEIYELGIEIEELSKNKVANYLKIRALKKMQNKKKQEHTKLYGGSEICSEFSFKEYVRYVDFIQKKFEKEYKLNLTSQEKLFDLSFADTFALRGMHPGALAGYMEELVNVRKIATKFRADPELFAGSR